MPVSYRPNAVAQKRVPVASRWVLEVRPAPVENIRQESNFTCNLVCSKLIYDRNSIRCLPPLVPLLVSKLLYQKFYCGIPQLGWRKQYHIDRSYKKHSAGSLLKRLQKSVFNSFTSNNSRSRTLLLSSVRTCLTLKRIVFLCSIFISPTFLPHLNSSDIILGSASGVSEPGAVLQKDKLLQNRFEFLTMQSQDHQPCFALIHVV